MCALAQKQLNFIQHVLLWKFRLKMRTMVDMERIIWRTSKAFVFGNAYNIVLAIKPGEQGVPQFEMNGRPATRRLAISRSESEKIPG